MKFTERLKEDVRTKMIQQMESYGESDSEPKVGIFWYNKSKHELFDVWDINVSDANGSPLLNFGRTISKLHRDVWKKKQQKDLAKGVSSIYTKRKFTDVPRGRVFEKNGKFIIVCGSYMNDGVKDLAIDEFNLQGQDVEVLIDEHWGSW